MNGRRVTIEVLEAVSDDPDYAHIVRITVYDGERQLQSADLPGGDFENARGIAEGLVRLVNAGTDITRIVPDVKPNVNDEIVRTVGDVPRRGHGTG